MPERARIMSQKKSASVVRILYMNQDVFDWWVCLFHFCQNEAEEIQ